VGPLFFFIIKIALVVMVVEIKLELLLIEFAMPGGLPNGPSLQVFYQ